MYYDKQIHDYPKLVFHLIFNLFWINYISNLIYLSFYERFIDTEGDGCLSIFWIINMSLLFNINYYNKLIKHKIYVKLKNIKLTKNKKKQKKFINYSWKTLSVESFISIFYKIRKFWWN